MTYADLQLYVATLEATLRHRNMSLHQRTYDLHQFRTDLMVKIRSDQVLNDALDSAREGMRNHAETPES